MLSRLRIRLLGTTMLFLLLATQAQAKTIYVRPGSSGDGLSWANAKPTVSQGLALAVSGDLVWVTEGTYPNTHINVPNGVALYGGFAGTETSLSQRSVDPVGTNPTSLDGGGGGWVVYVAPASTPQRVDGFIIRNGQRGVYIDRSSAVIANNRVEDNLNTANDGYGNESSGIFGISASAVITHNTVTRNRSLHGDGGGIHFIFPSSPIISDNEISYNHAGRYTGGLHFYNTDNATVQNNRIIGNDSPGAGGLMFGAEGRGSIVLDGNLFQNNSSGGGAGGAVIFSHVRATVTNNSFNTNFGEAGLVVWGGQNSIKYNLFQGNNCYAVGGALLNFCMGEVSHNSFLGNTGETVGGLLVQFGTLLIAHNEFDGNIAHGLDGFYSAYTQATLLNNRIVNHVGIGLGSAGNDAPIANNLIAHNGRGLYLNASASRVINNTIADSGNAGVDSYNSPNALLGNNIIAFNDTGIRSDGNLSLRNNCVSNNTLNYQGVSAGASDINSDPLFIDHANNVYQLQATSPAADAGDDALIDVGWLAFGNTVRIIGSHVDMGAYERVGYEGLCALIDVYITKEGIHNSLCAKLRAAAAAEARGNLGAKGNILSAFVNEVQAQTDKAITPSNANILIALVATL